MADGANQVTNIDTASSFWRGFQCCRGWQKKEKHLQRPKEWWFIKFEQFCQPFVPRRRLLFLSCSVLSLSLPGCCYLTRTIDNKNNKKGPFEDVRRNSIGPWFFSFMKKRWTNEHFSLVCTNWAPLLTRCVSIIPRSIQYYIAFIPKHSLGSTQVDVASSNASHSKIR